MLVILESRSRRRTEVGLKVGPRRVGRRRLQWVNRCQGSIPCPSLGRGHPAGSGAPPSPDPVAFRPQLSVARLVTTVSAAHSSGGRSPLTIACTICCPPNRIVTYRALTQHLNVAIQYADESRWVGVSHCLVKSDNRNQRIRPR